MIIRRFASNSGISGFFFSKTLYYMVLLNRFITAIVSCNVISDTVVTVK